MAKKFDLESYKESEEDNKVIYKPDKYIIMPECFQDCVGLPGVQLGASHMFYGLSDSGKTITMLHIAKAAQSQNILPILILTENKLDKKRMQEVGLDTENCIIKEDLSTLEDVYDYISTKIKHLKEDKLPYDIVFLWDSVASTPSRESFEVDKEGKITKKYGPQKNAAVIGYYNPIIMKMITSTKQEDCPHYAGLVLIQQAYISPPAFPGAPATVTANGGEKIWFPLSTSVEIKEGKRLKATVKGQQKEFALISRLKVKKNHISELNCEGELVFAGKEMFHNDEKLINEYKKAHKEEWEQ